jgi:hypothetical protein
LKEGGGTSRAHWSGGITTAVASDSSLPAVDFTGEEDKRCCRFIGKVAVQFTLADAVWLRGRKRGAHNGFPVEAEREEGRERGPAWACHAEKKQRREEGPAWCTHGKHGPFGEKEKWARPRATITGGGGGFD